MTDHPELSIVIGAVRPGLIIRECLAALDRQRHAGVEVIVVAGDHDGTAALVREEFPWVGVIESDHASLPQLRGIGIAESRAPLVGILDAWCIVSDQWIQNAVRAHNTHSEPAIGGGVNLSAADQRRWRVWVTYLYDYWEYVPPFATGHVNALPGNSIVYKRHAFPDAVELRTRGFWKAFANKALTHQGERLVSSAGLTVTLRRSLPLGRFFLSRFDHGRAYSSMRVEQDPFVKRLAWAVGTPLLPVVFLARQLRGLFNKPRARWWFIACLPALLVLHVSWACGETIGYLFGAGSSQDRMHS